MGLLEEIITEKGLLRIDEDVEIQSVSDAINTMRPAYIKYNSGGKNKATGRRLIYPVAYGMSSAGNPVVRAFEERGDSLTGVPAWKFFRVDRILWWRTIKDSKYSFKGKDLVGLNKSGDEGMIEIYTLSPLCGQLNDKNEPQIDADPITKGDVSGEKGKMPGNNEKKWGFKQIGKDIKNFFDKWKNKYRTPEVSLDNDGNITYDNGEVKKVEKMRASDTKPVSKTEIPTSSTQNEPDKQEANGDESRFNATSEPVTKGEIEGETSSEEVKDDTDKSEEAEITKAFNDLNDRWNNLNKGQPPTAEAEGLR